jgi:hypothetical protein
MVTQARALRMPTTRKVFCFSLSFFKKANPCSSGTPKGHSHLPLVCATPGQLDHFVALALQQNGQQSALRKGQV